MAPPARPIIGINADFIPANKVHRAHVRLNVGYFESVLAAGGLPVVLPPLGKEPEINYFLDRVDGFLLTGGLDLDPRRRGLPPHSAVHPMAERREENDRILVRLLMQRQVPTVAIGVGMHQLNVACGGSLFLHLPEEQPRSMPHFDPSGQGPHRHAVLVQTGTHLDEIYGNGEILVNSQHHQAIKQVGSRFRICAQAPDGVIEAIESVDPSWFCIGVQWHPESESASALDMQLFESFLKACARKVRPISLAA
jgi:putative glutamine amidotransferase